MCAVAPNLRFALADHQTLDIHVEQVEAGASVTITGKTGSVSVTHADAAEALRLALVQITL